MPAERPGEFARIRDIVRSLPAGEGVIVGPGDDAAVLRPAAGRDLVVTTDAFVEGRHFRRDLLDDAAIGVRLAAANLSDLAAMAAKPRWAVIAAAAPQGAPAGMIPAIERACAAALSAEGAAIVGGNLSATDGPAWFAVTLIGEVEPGRHWTRTGAHAADRVAVTGHPGRAAAALALARTADPPTLDALPPALRASYVAPPSRVRLALALAAAGVARAAIDLSDGLAGDLARLCAASGVGATLEESAWPFDAALEEALARIAGGRPDAAAADALRYGAGDDYELLLAIDPERWGEAESVAAAHGAPLHAIGRFTATSGAVRLLRREGGSSALPGAGYDHFR